MTLDCVLLKETNPLFVVGLETRSKFSNLSTAGLS